VIDETGLIKKLMSVSGRPVLHSSLFMLTTRWRHMVTEADKGAAALVVEPG